MPSARAARRCQFQLAIGEPDLPYPLPVQVNDGQGVQVFSLDSDASSRPVGRDGDLALVPCRGELTQAGVLPRWVDKDGLRVLLHVVSGAWPAAGHFEVPPSVEWHGD